MKKKLFLAGLMCLLTSAISADDLMDIIGKDLAIFSENRPTFIKPSNANIFSWTSNERTSARYPAFPGESPELTLFENTIPEVIVFFEENNVSKVYISVYNKGDNQPIKTYDFQKKVKSIIRGLTALYPGEKPVTRKEKLSKGMHVYAIIWRGKKYSCTMKWSLSGKSKRTESPEFLQVEFEPFDPKDDPTKRSLVRADRTEIAARKSLPENVKQESNGNVFIDNIPMVDQGMKGYCVAAILERVLLYYNIPVNQHMLAQLGNTSAEGGTSVDVMVEALEDASNKFGIRVRNEYCLFPQNKWNKVLDKIISEYNHLAKKAGKPKVEPVKRDDMIYLDETIYCMDPELYSKVRSKDSDFRKFHRMIVKNVKAGVPVIWCVLLGIMPEDKTSLQTKGGHMRLIIGYNEKNQEILYTDSWGYGHELKSMPIQYAWTITTRTLYLLPREQKRF